MGLFVHKPKKDRPTDTQKNLISKKQACLNWYLNNDLKIQKWIFRILMIAIGVWFVVAIIISFAKGSQSHFLNESHSQTILNISPKVIIDTVTFLSPVIMAFLWKFLLNPFLNLLNSSTKFFKNLGAQGIVYSIIQNKSIEQIALIFFGAALTIFIVAIAIRGIKIATTRDADKQENIKRNTSLSIFGAVIGLFLTTTCFMFAISIVNSLSSWVSEATSGGTVDIGTFVYNYSCKQGVGHVTVLPEDVNTDDHSAFAMTILGISAAFFVMKFIIGAISAIFKMVVLYTTSFVALSKWPQDEGGSFMGHKDDLIGVFFNYILLYLLFNLFMILISAISPIVASFSSANSSFMPAVAGCSLFAAGSVAMTSLSKRLPELFSLKKDVGNIIKPEQKVSSSVKTTATTTKSVISHPFKALPRMLSGK